jgi:HEAT repeat protein
MRTLLMAAVVSLMVFHSPALAEVEEKIKVADSSVGPIKIYAVEWISNVLPPNDQVKAKVAKKLLEYLDDKESSVRGRAADALANWATEELAPRMMIEMAGNKPALKKGSIVGLGKIQYEKAIPTMVRYLESNIERAKVTEALVLMGPKAESALLKVLDNKDQGTVRQACFVLLQIGTSKSLPALQKATASKNRETAATAASAIEAIKDREASVGQK